VAKLQLAVWNKDIGLFGTDIGLTAFSVDAGDVEARVGDDQSKAKLYRRRAEEILAAAEGMTEPTQRTLLFQIAADYHKLATALEPPLQEPPASGDK
jgi:hypothetical protein